MCPLLYIKDPLILDERTALAAMTSRVSCIPRGDLDPARVKERISDTTSKDTFTVVHNIPYIRDPLTLWAHPLNMHMWRSQVENEHYSTLRGLIQVVISLECFIEITPDFPCPFMNA